MGTIDDVNKGVMDLWDKWADRLPRTNGRCLLPLLYPAMKQDVLLFVGMNPSFVPKAYKRILKNASHVDIAPETLFDWSGRTRLDWKRLVVIEDIMRSQYPFFHKFKDIAEAVSMGYEHVDLFFNRETRQKEFQKKIIGNDAFSEFVQGQLELSSSLIRYLRPKLIVVANAGASKLFENRPELGKAFELQWVEEYGHHTAVVNDKAVPVFLASMLTGQRAMDDGSYRRLKWHIKKALTTPESRHLQP